MLNNLSTFYHVEVFELNSIDNNYSTIWLKHKRVNFNVKDM